MEKKTYIIVSNYDPSINLNGVNANLSDYSEIVLTLPKPLKTWKETWQDFEPPKACMDSGLLKQKILH